MSKHKLPPMVFVYEETDGEDTFYLAYKNVRDTATPEEARFVGKYYLNSVQEVSMKVSRKNVR